MMPVLRGMHNITPQTTHPPPANSIMEHSSASLATSLYAQDTICSICLETFKDPHHPSSGRNSRDGNVGIRLKAETESNDDIDL